MNITLAKTAGFCFGVNRAVEMVYELLDKNEKVCTLGPIIHNPQLVGELEERGVRIVDDPYEVDNGSVLVIRSHGVSAAVYEQAKESGLNVCDATCPFVAKIHRIVSDADSKGHTVLIAGDANHHEVLGIKGHTNGEVYIFANEDELENLIENHPDLSEKELTVVAQTTFNADLWKKCQKKLKKVYTNAIIFDTICSATANRQNEAKNLASKSDVMIVIGGRHSSNTAKLAEVCLEKCSRTHLIETAAELEPSMLQGAENIGVAAGASTPSGIIKEVIKTMSEILENKVVEGSDVTATAVEAVQPEKSFEEMTFEEALEASLNGLNTDQKVRGVVLSVSPTEIQVDIGRKHTGYVSESEFSNDPTVKLVDAVKVGDVLDLIVMRTNDQEGTVMLSKKKYDARLGWDKILAAKDNDTILDGVVTEINNGGVVAVAEGCRVFIPASQASVNRGEDLTQLKGTHVSFRIIEIGRGRRVIGSIRSVLREQRKALSEKFWAEVEVGKVYTGVVKSLTSYGAFVDLGGVDGMVHISELSWSRIKHPSEVVNVGDTVEVYVKDIDAEKKKISLGYKKIEDNPWEILKRDYPVDTVAKVTIVSMTAYGAFARIIPGIDGLIHISQIADRRIEKPQDELSIGQEVEAKIIAIDFDKKRVSLSMRALLADEEAPAAEEATEEAE